MSGSDPEESLVRGQPGRLLFAFSFGTMAVMTGQFVLSPLLPAIIEDLGIRPSRAGIALSVMYGLAGLAHYPGGRLADQTSRKTILILSGLIVVIAAAQLFFVANFWMFIIAVASFGIGLGFYQTAGMVMIADLFERKLGLAYGINSAMLNLGGLISGGLAALVIGLGVWQSAFLPVLVVMAGVLVVIHFWSHEPYRMTRPEITVRPTLRKLGRDPKVVLTIGAFVAFSFSFQGTINFFPSLLFYEKGFTSTNAAYAFAFVFIVSTAANLVAGRFGDTTSYLFVGGVSAAAAIVGLITILASESLLGIGIGIILFGAGSAAFWPVMYAELISYFPTGGQGGPFGAAQTIFVGIGSFGTTYIGFVAESFSFTVAYLGSIGIFLLSGVLITSVALLGRTDSLLKGRKPI